ncbi:hypothetical protein UFOVP592_23 [uncultured Caudovirales phage]|uniref:Uncharacterized protein n=1 Tax=uncultured Caudovirales phage TaxID=2100421 RepID=A0A6J5N0D9_9CAUD|nr:hypothetical protein UFOVP592_23 [uncultured Caudovirales phage]
MAFNREAALAEGYTEDEINAYMQAEAAKNKETPVTVDPGEPPPPPTTPMKTVEPTASSVGTTAAVGVAPYVGTAALGAGGLYGAGVAKQAFDAYKQGNAVKQAHIDLQYDKMQQAANKAAGVGPAVPTGGAQVGSVAPAGGVAANEPMGQKPASMNSRVQAAAANNIKNLPPATMMGNVGKMAGRVLPGAGTVLNAYDAYDRAKQGDYVGAGIAGLGAAASPFPVVGTAVGMGTGAINAYRDYRKQQEEEEKRRMTK